MRTQRDAMATLELVADLTKDEVQTDVTVRFADEGDASGPFVEIAFVRRKFADVEWEADASLSMTQVAKLMAFLVFVLGLASEAMPPAER